MSVYNDNSTSDEVFCSDSLNDGIVFANSARFFFVNCFIVILLINYEINICMFFKIV